MTSEIETQTIEGLTRTAKATLLKSIIEAAEDEGRAPVLETLATAFAAVVSNGPKTGELTE